MTTPVAEISSSISVLDCSLERTPLELLRQRLRKRISIRLSSDPSANEYGMAEMILLFNWARGLPGTRGFCPLKHLRSNAGHHPNQSLIRLIEQATSLLIHLDLLVRDESEEDRALAHSDFRTWSMAIARNMLVAQFNALEPGAPGLKRLLSRVSALTPHGPSSAQEHGRQARAYWHAIDYQLRVLANPNALYPSGREGVTDAHLANVRLPAWAQIPAHAEYLVNAARCVTARQINTYLTMHDCGKAFCLTVDADGRNHYPNHAAVSAEVWAKAGGTSVECELMRKDMLVHTASASSCIELANDYLAPILLLSTLAEIHANAQPIFKGFASDSFKIKFKQIERRGAALLKTWMGESNTTTSQRCVR